MIRVFKISAIVLVPTSLILVSFVCWMNSFPLEYYYKFGEKYKTDLFCNCTEYNKFNPSIAEQYSSKIKAIINFIAYDFSSKSDDVTNQDNPKKLNRKGFNEGVDRDNNPSNNSVDHELNLASYLTTHTFNINGNGKVEFVNNEMIVEGGRATIHGNYSITSTKTARITNYQAIDGLYDASNNRAGAGTLTLNSDGTISFFLTDGNNVRNYTLSPSN